MRVLVWGLIFTGTEQYHLFLDIRKEFGSGVNKFFAYADGGVNFCWLTDNEKNMYLTDDHFNTGFYTDLGLGYKIGCGKNESFIAEHRIFLEKIKGNLSDILLSST